MEKYLLKVLDLFAWFFKSMRVDYDQLHAIVATKLTMDNRRQLVGYLRRRKSEKTNIFGRTLIFYALFGAFVALAMYGISSFILSMVVFFTYIMVMVSMTLITDFSSILLDTSDNTIILPRPVDSRTLFAARLTHILLYLGQLAFGLAVIPAAVVAIQYGTLVFIFLIAVALSILTALFLTNALYLIVMQFADEEKLKTVINYFQIVMAIFIMGGYQALPRMMERIDIASFKFTIHWWSFLLPPIWMAGSLEAFHFTIFDIAHWGLVACAVLMPVVGIYMVNKYLSPVFNNKIAAIGGSTTQIKENKIRRSSAPGNISRWIAASPVERGVFEIVYKILGRDRKIKLKIYPSFGYVAVFGLIFMLRSQEDIATTWANLPNTQYHLLLLYLSFMVLQVALHEIPYADDFKASWIYYAPPLDSPGEVLSGMLKAIAVRLFFPGFIVISGFVLFVWGFQVSADIIIALFNNLLMLMLLAIINKRHLPFSMAPDVRAQSGNLMRSILTILSIGMLGLSHFILTLLTKETILMLGVVPLQVTALYFIFRTYKRTTWAQITL